MDLRCIIIALFGPGTRMKAKGASMNLKNIFLCISFAIVLLAFAPPAQGQRKSKKRGIKLPPAVAATLKSECPDCVIAKVTRETENGVTIYDFEFKIGQGEMDVTADGFVIDRETPVQTDDVPAPALEAIRKAAAGGKIKLIEKDEIRAELKDGKVTKLDSPKYAYEADLVKGNKVGEVVVTPDGQVTEGPKWRRKGTKE
jgi:predicted lipoprotein with Yx(FWY)xxD motif